MRKRHRRSARVARGLAGVRRRQAIQRFVEKRLFGEQFVKLVPLLFSAGFHCAPASVGHVPLHHSTGDRRRRPPVEEADRQIGAPPPLPPSSAVSESSSSSNDSSWTCAAWAPGV